ncbi:hypothetical protein [Microcoleus sp. S36b_A4]
MVTASAWQLNKGSEMVNPDVTMREATSLRRSQIIQIILLITIA